MHVDGRQVLTTNDVRVLRCLRDGEVWDRAHGAAEARLPSLLAREYIRMVDGWPEPTREGLRALRDADRVAYGAFA